MRDWVARVGKRPPTDVTHEQVIDALYEVRDEMGTRSA